MSFLPRYRYRAHTDDKTDPSQEKAQDWHKVAKIIDRGRQDDGARVRPLQRPGVPDSRQGLLQQPSPQAARLPQRFRNHRVRTEGRGARKGRGVCEAEHADGSRTKHIWQESLGRCLGGIVSHLVWSPYKCVEVTNAESSTSQDRPATPEAPFKARLFLHRRYSDAWSVAPDEIISCPSTPNELESVADEEEPEDEDEDETLVSLEDEQGEEQAGKTLVTDKTETVASPEEEQREEPADEEWENISEKEVREACAENDDVVANKSTETEMDELLVSGSSKTRMHSLLLTFPSAKGCPRHPRPHQPRLPLRHRLVRPQAVPFIAGQACRRHPVCEGYRLRPCPYLRSCDQKSQQSRPDQETLEDGAIL